MTLTLSSLRRNSDLMALKELRRKWGQRKQSCIPSDPGGGGSSWENGQELKPSLPLLQVWPSQDSPRGEGDGQCFVFPPHEDPSASGTGHSDSGIDSFQASPSCNSGSPNLGRHTPNNTGPSLSASLLHPDRARLMRRPSTPEQSLSLDESDTAAPPSPLSPASSTGSSITSVAAVNAVVMAQLARERDQYWEHQRDRRRSSTMTARYSLLDALDLEYALIRAAARGSIGPYSLSESVHKLTFTQSLAFPGLARGLATKRRRSSIARSTPASNRDSGLNAFAKVVTALVLVLVSVMVFGVVYKFVKT